MLSTTNKELDRAIRDAGSIEALAHMLRVGESTVRVWMKNDRVSRASARLLAVLTRPELAADDPRVKALERRLRG